MDLQPRMLVLTVGLEPLNLDIANPE